MPPTGETCQLTGVYRSDCQHRLEVRFSRGDKFTPCPSDRRAINWSLVRS